MRWKQNWNNMPLRHKMSVSFMVLCTILVLVITLVVNLIYRSIMDTQMQERNQYEEKLMTQQLEKFLTNVNSCSNNVILGLNVGFQQFPGAPEFAGSSSVAINRMFINGMINNILMFTEASRISVVLSTGNFYTGNRVNLRDSVSVNLPLFEYLKEEKIDTSGRWLYGLNESFGSSVGEISYVRSMRNTNTNQEIGYVIICIDPSTLQVLYDQPPVTSYTYYGIFNAEGTLLSPINEESPQEAAAMQAIAEGNVPPDTMQTIHHSGKSYYGKKTSLSNKSGWMLISLMDWQAAMAGANVITGAMLFVGLLAMIGANLIISLIAKKISSPIQEMAAHMVCFPQGMPSELPTAKSRDEIGVLTENFNTMIRKNKELFENVYEEQKLKRHYELALLQSQIKPHFLYNTLDTAYCLADVQQTQGAKKVLKLLADYYRAVLNKGSEWISVAKELEAVEKYLQIQQIRYSDLFAYEIEIPMEILQLQIPKLTLQPLVENSIYHGLKPRGAGGRLRILGEMEGDWVFIRIWDNGIGFSEEKFHSLLEDKSRDDEGDSFGLKNSYDRIRLFYGENSCLRLEPGIQEGTMISLCIFLGIEGEENV